MCPLQKSESSFPLCNECIGTFIFGCAIWLTLRLLLQTRAIDFAELKNAALLGGIWPGVATFLLLVSKYVEDFGGSAPVPPEVLAAAYTQDIRVYLGGNFLRVPKGPAAALYASQLMNAGRNVDLRAMARLPLLPPLAISALLALQFTGSDKGVWYVVECFYSIYRIGLVVVHKYTGFAPSRRLRSSTDRCASVSIFPLNS